MDTATGIGGLLGGLNQLSPIEIDFSARLDGDGHDFAFLVHRAVEPEDATDFVGFEYRWKTLASEYIEVVMERDFESAFWQCGSRC